MSGNTWQSRFAAAVSDWRFTAANGSFEGSFWLLPACWLVTQTFFWLLFDQLTVLFLIEKYWPYFWGCYFRSDYVQNFCRSYSNPVTGSGWWFSFNSSSVHGAPKTQRSFLSEWREHLYTSMCSLCWQGADGEKRVSDCLSCRRQPEGKHQVIKMTDNTWETSIITL